MHRLSIIIVNWNSQDFVRQCLRSLDRHTGIDCQIIVVDGASFDGCDEMIAREFPAVEFVQSQENVGFGRCNNLGATRATGKFLLFLNPDTEVTPGAVELLLEEAEGNPQIGLVGAKLLNSDGSLQTSCVQALPSPLNQALDSDFLRRLFPKSRLWGNSAAFASTIPCAVEAVSGACMLVHRDTFAQVGGFSPDYFMYAEDMHLCWEIYKLGKSVVYHPAAEVMHHGGGASTGDFSCFSCLEMRRALHHFILCRQGTGAGLAYRALIAVSAIARLTALSAAISLQSGVRRSRTRASLTRWWTNLLWAIRPPGRAIRNTGHADRQLSKIAGPR
jgi:GT2 family glycosyltransferase